MINRREQAATWLMKLQEPDISAGELLRWEAWMNRSSRNRRAFGEVERLSRRIADYADDLKDIPVPSHPGREYGRPAPAVASSSGHAGPAGIREFRFRDRWAARPSWVRRCALTAVVAAVLAVGALLVRFSAPLPQADESVQAHQTAVAEHRRITLPDGSLIALGAKSSLTVNFSDEQRFVMLESGEALFEVAEESGRPFVVMAGAGTITALGTAFNVLRHRNRVVVTVSEGSVQVERTLGATVPGQLASRELPQRTSATVGAGAQAVISPTELSVVELQDPNEVTQWRAGRLVFRAEPLKYVVERVSRYSGTEILIIAPEVEEMLFTGSVFHDQTDDWLQALEDVFPIEVQPMSGNRVVIRKRLDSSAY